MTKAEGGTLMCGYLIFEAQSNARSELGALTVNETV
jgi:hypothetical protein